MLLETYQEVACQKILKLFAINNNATPLLQAPRGSGKKYVSCALASRVNAQEMIVFGSCSSREEGWIETSKKIGIPCRFLTYKVFIRNVNPLPKRSRMRGHYIRAYSRERLLSDSGLTNRSQNYSTLHSKILNFFSSAFAPEKKIFWVFDECHLLYNSPTANERKFLCTSILLNFIRQVDEHHSLLQTSQMRVDLDSAQRILVILGRIPMNFMEHPGAAQGPGGDLVLQTMNEYVGNLNTTFTEAEWLYLQNYNCEGGSSSGRYGENYVCHLIYNKHVKWKQCVYMTKCSKNTISATVIVQNDRHHPEGKIKFTLLEDAINYLLNRDYLTKEIIKEHVECLEYFKLPLFVRHITKKKSEDPNFEMVVFLNARENVIELKQMLPLCGEANIFITTYSSTSVNLPKDKDAIFLMSPTPHLSQLFHAIGSLKEQQSVELFLENENELQIFPSIRAYLNEKSSRVKASVEYDAMLSINNLDWKISEHGGRVEPLFHIRRPLSLDYLVFEKEYYSNEKKFQEHHEWLQKIIFEIENNMPCTYFSYLSSEILNYIYLFLL